MNTGSVSQSIGYFMGIFAVIAFFAWLVPWASISAVNAIFDSGLRHSLQTYFFIWVLFLLWRGVTIPRVNKEE